MKEKIKNTLYEIFKGLVKILLKITTMNQKLFIYSYREGEEKFKTE